MLVKLSTARCGHRFDKDGRFTGVFAQAAGDEVEMDESEAKRYIERGMASEVRKQHNNK